MTLKIWTLKNDELIYENTNMYDLLHQYGIDKDDQESFETELLNDIFFH